MRSTSSSRRAPRSSRSRPGSRSRRVGLAPDRALPPLLGHARRHAPQVHARRRRRGRHEPVEQVQRALRRRSQPARLRARHELARPRAARRDARDDREPLRGQGAEQPERRVRPLERGDPLPRTRGTAACPASARSAAELGFQGVYRLEAGGGEPEAPRRPRRVRAAERPLLLARRVAPVHQRHAEAYIDVYDAGPDGRPSNRRRFFSGVGSGVIEEGIPDGMKCDERGNIWVTGPGGIWVISAAGEHSA